MASLTCGWMEALESDLAGAAPAGPSPPPPTSGAGQQGSGGALIAAGGGRPGRFSEFAFLKVCVCV